MMQKLNGLITIFFLIAAGCKKPQADDLGGTCVVRGSLYINDTLRNFSGALPLRGQEVFVKYPADRNNLNYLYKVTANAEGSFTLTNLQKDTSYYLYAEKEENGLMFAAGQLIKLVSDTTVISDTLYPVFRKYNLLKITCRDTTSLSNPLFNAKVCVFTSSQTAQFNQCAGSYVSGTTDINGNVFFPRLAPGNYYVNAELVTPGLTIRQVSFITVPVPASGLAAGLLKLQ